MRVNVETAIRWNEESEQRKKLAATAPPKKKIRERKRPRLNSRRKRRDRYWAKLNATPASRQMEG